MNIEQTKHVLKNMPSDKSVMLHAKHGVGKSSVVAQVAEELSAETGKDYGFWDVRLSHGWRVVSAVNSDDEYDVVELDPALHDRWFHVDFDPSAAEWMDWARDQKVHPTCVEFINRNQNLLDPPVGNLEAGRIYPSRRSWVAFSDSILGMNLIDSQDDGMLTQVAKGWVGREIAVMFQKFVVNEFSHLRPEDVLDNFEKMKPKIENACNDIEVIAALARSVVAEVNGRSLTKTKDKQRKALREFFMMLPNDVASQSWVALLSGAKTKKIVMEWQGDEDFRDHLKQIYLTT